MKIDNDFIRILVEEDNPIPSAWERLLSIWLHHTNKDTKDYYYSGEEEAKAFEEFLLKTYDEFFVEVLARACVSHETPFKDEGDTCFIVMDGMSIREGALIYKALEQQGFEVKLSYNFSGIPSTTEGFRVKAAKPNMKIRFTEINKPKQIRISGDERFIWSYFPDVMLDKIQMGHTVISSLENMYKTSQDILMKILSKLTCSKIVILSDHGYIRSEAGFSFAVPESIKKKLRDILGGNRYVPMNDMDASNLVNDGYLCEFSGSYLVKSRYIWPVPGKYSIYLHGGLSLMECITPVIEVKK